jgi:ribosomal-protein-serine acetyltransferase
MFRLSDGADLEVRVVEAADAAPLFALIDHNRPYLREWLGWVDGTHGVADMVNFVQRSQEQFAMHNGFQAGIWYQGALTGVIGYHYLDWQHRQTEIGYWLAPQFQGHGIMTRACHLLVDYAICALGLHRVQIRAAPENRKSRGVPERLGLVQEGVQQQAEWLYDHFVDLVVYRALAGEWRCPSPTPEPHT